MGYSVEQECPQCGGPIALEETDRLISCPFCNVRSFISNTEPFRFVLPTKHSTENTLYAPYIRFKGSIFTCQGLQIKHQVMDVTHCCYSNTILPLTLGFRPQTQKMRFIGPQFSGAYLPSQIDLDEALNRINAHPLRQTKQTALHTAHIGDSYSYIYLPLVVKKNTLQDMVTDSPLGKISHEDDLYSAAAPMPQWKPIFLATLCPSCGWNLNGERDSLILFCQNCTTAWQTTGTSLAKLDFTTYFAGSENELLLPFWKLSVEGKGVQLDTLADFIRLTNQPRIIQPEWEKTKLSFISPAFKIRPKSYLRLADLMTLSQHKIENGETTLPSLPYPINLPKSEAEQSLKTILASTTVAKKNLMPLLPDIQFRVQSSHLLLMAFNDNGHGFYQENLQINVNKKALEYGRHL